MIKFSNKADVKILIKDLKANGFTVINSDGWFTAVDDDGTKVMEALPHSGGSYMLRLNEDYFSAAGQLYTRCRAFTGGICGQSYNKLQLFGVI